MSRSLFKARLAPAIVAVGKHSLAWVDDASSEDTVPHVEPLGEDMNELRGATTTLQGRAIRWIFDLERMPVWLQAPPIGTRSLDELRTFARVHATNRLGPAQDGNGEWVVDGQWHASEPFMCRAITPTLHSLLGKTPLITSALGLGLSLIRPHRDTQWYGLSTRHEAHLAFLDKGKCLHLRSFRVAPNATVDEFSRVIRKEWQMEIIRTNRSKASLQWVHLAPHTPIDLPPDVSWFSEPLQQYLADYLAGANLPEDSENLLNVARALNAWEKRQ